MNLILPNKIKTSIPVPPFDLEWKDNGEIATRQGLRHLFVSPAPDGWWDYWADHKESLKAVGFSCKKDDSSGEWQVACWLDAKSGKFKKKAEVNAKLGETLTALSRAEAPSQSFAPIVPKGVTPYGYQAAGVEYALHKDRVIIGDDMGLGKTIQAIMVCNHINAQNVLVVCPASLRLNWHAEWCKFATCQISGLQPILSKEDIQLIPQNNVVFISYDIMSSNEAQAVLRARTWDCVIIDEAHYLKNKETKRATRLLGLPPRAKSKDKAAPREPIPAKRYVMLTGTPVSNRPEDFWNLLRFCDPDLFGNWTRFANHFCDAKQTAFGWDTSGSSNLHELQKLVRSSCMVRRLKKDVLTQLPPKTRKIVALPTPDKIVRELDILTMEYRTSEETVAEMKQKLAEAQEAGDADAMQAAADSLKSAQQIAFSETSRIRKEIGIKKADLAIEHIEEILDGSSTKIIVGAHHKEVVKILADQLSKYRPVVVTGDTDPSKRHLAVTTFQNDAGCRIFIGNILAAGTGLTLTASPHVVIVEPDWVPANNMQFEDRAHRIGQSQPVLIEYLAMEGTIDINILRANARKMDVIEQSIDREKPKGQDELQVATYDTTVPVNPNKPTAQRIAEAAADDAERRIRKMAVMKLGQSLSPRELLAAIECVRKVAAMDGDRAQVANNIGFSKVDTDYGKNLASKNTQDLTDFEKGRMAQMAWKYRRQCPESLTSLLKKP